MALAWRGFCAGRLVRSRKKRVMPKTLSGIHAIENILQRCEYGQEHGLSAGRPVDLKRVV